MQVTFLGTADGHTSAHRNHSGILLRTPETTLLLDCGAPVAPYLLREKIDADLPHGIWLSHAHSDHIGQFPSLIQSLWLRARRAPLHIYAPPSLAATLRDYLEKCLLFPELIGFPIHWHDLKPGARFTLGAFELRAFATNHLVNLASFFQKGYPGTCFECYGATIDYQKNRYLYSADLALPQEMRGAIKPSRQPKQKPKRIQALFCELTHFPDKALFEELAGASIDSLWITHYPDHLGTEQAALRKLARKCGFKGEVHVMHDQQSCLLKFDKTKS